MNSAILHVCQHRYPYFRFGYSKQTIFSENDPARDKLQCANASQETTPRLDFQGGSKLRVKLLATYIKALHPSSTDKKFIVKLDLAYR